MDLLNNEINNIQAQFTELKRLKIGWNEGEGIPPDRFLLFTCENVITNLCKNYDVKLPSIHPVEDGSIDFNWDYIGLHCTLEIIDDIILLYIHKIPKNVLNVEDIDITELNFEIETKLEDNLIKTILYEYVKLN